MCFDYSLYLHVMKIMNTVISKLSEHGQHLYKRRNLHVLTSHGSKMDVG